MATKKHSYDILIPIFNAYGDVKRCLQSVLRNTPTRHPIYLLDDKSTDPRILPLLREFALLNQNIRLFTSDKNQGFVKNVNRGFHLSQNSVVLLNSDTQVPAQWLERLEKCRESDSRIGIISPLTNYGSILAVPRMNARNSIPKGMSLDEYAKRIASLSLRRYPRIPTAVGFCMLITRETIKKIGIFNPVFSPGYGEENDYCMRAWKQGIEVVCCDNAFVFHKGRASFNRTSKRKHIYFKNMETLHRLWPNYRGKVQAFIEENPLAEMQFRIDQIKSETILHVFGSSALEQVPFQDGQPEKEALDHQFPSVGLKPEFNQEKRPQSFPERLKKRQPSYSFKVDQTRYPLSITNFPLGLNDSDMDAKFSRLLKSSAHSIVHFHHLGAWGNLRLPLLAKSRGKKVVISVRDHFLLCPDADFLYQGVKKCEKLRAEGADQDCVTCLEGKKHSRFYPSVPLWVDWKRYLRDRNAYIDEVIQCADAFVFPTSYAQERFITTFGRRVHSRCHVITPFFPENSFYRELSAYSSPLRVGFLGEVISCHEGETVLEVISKLSLKGFEFVIFGDVEANLKPRLHSKGVKIWSRVKFRRLKSGLRQVDLVISLNVNEPFFNQGIGIAQSLGIPIIASNLGAISSQIVHGKNGFLVSLGNPKLIEQYLLELSTDRSLLSGMRNELIHKRKTLNSVSLEDYGVLYDKLRDGLLPASLS